ncbi:MAG TPA: GNAT family N-acetyltransferase [Sphingomicrobium sp.]|nr:GNAT family N-acetyltransferase [Sphingomicrobium sp.]
MSEPRLDALAETARNRGLRLVRSRVRTPDKPRFGRAGLVDASGKPVFGMDEKGPAAAPEEIEDYFRDLEVKDWGASLDSPHKVRPHGPSAKDGSTRLRRARQHSTASGNAQQEPKPGSRATPAPKLKPPPKPKIRQARSGDAGRLAELINELGHEINTKQVSRNLTSLIKSGEAPLVATIDGKIVGLCGIGKRVLITRPAPLGRITSLIVTGEFQGHGIGRMLVEAAEAWMRQNGCALVEVTSNDRRAEAHAFYRHLGYERTSIRFVKAL